MNSNKSFSSLNLSRHSSCSGIEQVSMENLSDLNLSMIKDITPIDQFVSQRVTPRHQHFELTGTDTKKKMKLKFKKDLKIKIKSNQVKRQELEHIDQACLTFQKIPDWGYGKADQLYDEPVEGWQNFLDLVQNTQKYEMVENAICSRHLEIKQEKTQARKAMQVQALKKKMNICCGKGLVEIMREKKPEKSKHQIMIEELDVINKEQNQQIKFMEKQKAYHNKKNEAEKNRQLSQEKKYEGAKRLSWIEKPKNFANSILNEKREQEIQKNHLFMKKNQGQEKNLKMKLAKIILRKSAPQQIMSRAQKAKEVEVVADEEKPVSSKFVKDVTVRQRKSIIPFCNFEDNITTASSGKSGQRQFGNSVMPNSFSNRFSDVNQRVEEESEDDAACPFDIAIEDIQEEFHEESPLKLHKQKSSDTILQMQAYRTENMSRNFDQNDVKIVRQFKRHSHIAANTPQNEQLNFRPRIGHSDSLKPFMADQLTNNTSAIQTVMSPYSPSNKYGSSSFKQTFDGTNMSVYAKQVQFKDIVRNKSKSNKKLFKILKEKRQSIKPESEAASVRYSEPLPFTFTPRNSGGRGMNLEDLQQLSADKQNLFPALNSNTEAVSSRVLRKSKLVVPLSKIQFTADNTVLNSFRN